MSSTYSSACCSAFYGIVHSPTTASSAKGCKLAAEEKQVVRFCAFMSWLACIFASQGFLHCTSQSLQPLHSPRSQHHEETATGERYVTLTVSNMTTSATRAHCGHMWPLAANRLGGGFRVGRPAGPLRSELVVAYLAYFSSGIPCLFRCMAAHTYPPAHPNPILHSFFQHLRITKNFLNEHTTNCPPLFPTFQPHFGILNQAPCAPKCPNPQRPIFQRAHQQPSPTKSRHFPIKNSDFATPTLYELHPQSTMPRQFFIKDATIDPQPDLQLCGWLPCRIWYTDPLPLPCGTAPRSAWQSRRPVQV